MPAHRQRTKPDICPLAAFGRYNSPCSFGWDMSADGDSRPNLLGMPKGRDQLGIRLDSWKEIASYLIRSERTVRRWEETEGLPVHRQLHEKRGSVYAYTGELDAWRQSRRLPERESSDPQEPYSPRLRNETRLREPQNDNIVEFQSIAPPAPPVRSRLAGTRFWLWSLLALLGVLLATYGLRQVPTQRSVPSFTVTPLTTDPGNEVQPTLSPDGNEVAFAFNDGHSPNYHIVLKTIGSDELVRLTSDSTDDRSPSWSPDGQTIAFLRFDSDQSARVMTIPSAGGTERELSKLMIEGTETEIRASWSPDGKWIATSDAEKPDSPMALVLISALTGEKKRLVYQPSPLDADLSPTFSPDGRYLAFARHLGSHTSDIYVLQLPPQGLIAGEARRLTNSNSMNRSPVWTGDGQNILFVGDHARQGYQIWSVPAFQRANAVSLNEIGQGISSIALNPQRNRLVYGKHMEDTNIWRIGLDSASPPGGQRWAASQPPLIASTRLDLNPQYSPDGKYIAFQSDRSGDCEIWIAKSDGSALRQMTRLHAEISGFPRWSPDGKFIVFHSRITGYANLYVLNVETGDYRKLTTGATNDAAPSWSHDGRWIYFESDRQDGVQIWRIPAGGGPATRLTKTNGALGLESADGKLLFYSKFSEPGLWVVPVEGGTEAQVLPSLYGFSNFAVSKRGIYFLHRGPDSEAVISFMSFSNRVVTNLAVVKLPIGLGLAVSPDESSILYTQFDRIDSDLFLVDNFR